MGSEATILSVTRELKEQPSLLRSLRGSALWSRLGDGGDPIFVGAGDSYAASLCASFLAGPHVLALDPYSLTESIGWADGRSIYIISISGETRTNVELARALKGVAKDITAITCNPRSRLATIADRVVELPFRPRGKSPGIASFTLSLAAALKVCGLDSDCDLDDILSRAKAESKRVRIASKRGVTHFAGNNEAYAASIYGVAKIYEFLGRRAQATLLEEFSHMPLFSLSTSDSVNVIESPEGHKGEQLCEGLRGGGYASSLMRLEGGRVERLYLLVFAMQMAALSAARSEGLERPYFLGAKKKLRISDEMIY
jgi:glucosamine 6-phosphate synthetase-like amidotransferase/phosphosugar isomerase protein